MNRKGLDHGLLVILLSVLIEKRGNEGKDGKGC